MRKILAIFLAFSLSAMISAPAAKADSSDIAALAGILAGGGAMLTTTSGLETSTLAAGVYLVFKAYQNYQLGNHVRAATSGATGGLTILGVMIALTTTTSRADTLKQFEQTQAFTNLAAGFSSRNEARLFMIRVANEEWEMERLAEAYPQLANQLRMAEAHLANPAVMARLNAQLAATLGVN